MSKVATEVLEDFAIELFAVLQPECLRSCNLFDKNYKNYMSKVCS
jgi:hypothetical protein